MAATDYRAVGPYGPPLVGSPGPTPWDPQLQLAMQDLGRAVMEERLLPDIIDDLRRAGSASSGGRATHQRRASTGVRDGR
jgi:hypothetical protein